MANHYRRRDTQQVTTVLAANLYRPWPIRLPHTEAMRRAVVGEINQLLAEEPNESELHAHVLRDYDLSYDPYDDEITKREWLSRVRDVRNVRTPP